MASFNAVTLMGNLTRDPELRHTQGGMAVCKVGLAVNRREKNKNTDQWEEKPTFVDVTIFGKRGEAFEKHHGKGDTAFFHGELRLDQWEDKNSGQRRSKLYVIANNWEFVNGGREFSGGGAVQAQDASPYGRGGSYAPQQTGSGDSFVADDTPF